jgi:hypothetical protein
LGGGVFGFPLHALPFCFWIVGKHPGFISSQRYLENLVQHSKFPANRHKRIFFSTFVESLYSSGPFWHTLSSCPNFPPNFFLTVYLAMFNRAEMSLTPQRLSLQTTSSIRLMFSSALTLTSLPPRS